MFEVDRETFVAMVGRALDELPEEFRERIANVDVAIEDFARPDDYARTRSPAGSTLLSLLPNWHQHSCQIEAVARGYIANRTAA